MINWKTKKRLQNELTDANLKNIELEASLAEKELQNKLKEMKNVQLEKICNVELEVNHNLLSKLNRTIDKHEKATQLINIHLKEKSRLEAKIKALECALETSDSENSRLKEYIEQTEFNEKQMMFEYTDEIELKDKKIEYLKTTLKNNLILFEHHEHKHYVLDRNKYLFNPFPFNKWEIAIKRAIEERLQEVRHES